MSAIITNLSSIRREKKPRRQTGEQICQAILKHLMNHRNRGQTWVPIEEFYRLDPKPPRVYYWLNRMNEKLLVIDRSKVQRLVALHSAELQKLCATPIR